MSVLYIVLPLALVLAVAAVAAFSWAVRSGQMDDLRTPALRILHDDVAPHSPQTNSAKDATSLNTAAKNGELETPVTRVESAPGGPRSDRDRERMSSTFAETPVARARLSHHDA